MAATLILVRHAESNWNREGRIQGDSDLARLTRRGLSQARLLKKRLALMKIDAAYSSPLCRAMETTKIIAPRIQIRTEKGLKERHFGRLEGRMMEDVEKEDMEAVEYFRSTRNFPYKDVETVERMAERGLKALKKIAKANNGKTILVVSHGGIIKAMLRKILSNPHPYKKGMKQANCAINVISFSGRNFSVKALNDTKHLGRLITAV